MATVETLSGATGPFTEYISEIADLMELKDWRILLDDSPCDEDCAGQAIIPYGRKVAQLAFSARFREEPAHERRHIIVHELLHCHLAAMNGMVESDLEGHLTAGEHSIIWNSYKRSMEYATDGISSIIARHMPLPPEDNAKRKQKRASKEAG